MYSTFQREDKFFHAARGICVKPILEAVVASTAVQMLYFSNVVSFRCTVMSTYFIGSKGGQCSQL